MNEQRLGDLLAAVQRVLDAVEFDDTRAMLYITIQRTEYGFAMDEKIENPLAEAIVLLGAEMDRTDEWNYCQQ